MHFKIYFNPPIYPSLYEDYCQFLFSEIKSAIEGKIDTEKYSLREPLVLKSSVIKWVAKPSKLDLVYYMTHCLIMTKDRGDYVIQFNPDMIVEGSLTPVSKLIKLLEFGNEKIKPLPVIREVMEYYSKNYPYLLENFFEKRLDE